MSRKVTVVIAIVCAGLFTTATASGQSVWQGAADDQWNEGLNWAPTGVPLGTTNVLFDATGAELDVDLGGGGDANVLDFTAGGQTIFGTGVLSLSSALRNLAGNNTISASISGAPLGVQVSGGSLRLSGSNSGLTGGAVVTGATLDIASPASMGGIGSVVLDGSTLKVGSSVQLMNINGLAASNFRQTTGRRAGLFSNYTDAMDGTTFTGVGNTAGLTAQTPNERAIQTGPLNYFNNFQTLFAGSGGDNFQTIWTGYFTPQTTDDYSFRIPQHDDRGTFYMDTDGDGILDLINWNTDQWRSTGTLQAGQSYAIAGAFLEWGGNESYQLNFTGGGFGDIVVNPTDGAQLGLWTYKGMQDNPYGTDVEVSGASAIQVGGTGGATMGNLLVHSAGSLTTSGGVTFGAVSMEDTAAIDGGGAFTATSLTVPDAATVTLGGAATFGSTTVTGGAGRTANFNVLAGQTASLGTVSDGGSNMILTKIGDGRLDTAGGTTLTGSTVNVSAGRLGLCGDNSGIDPTTSIIVAAAGTLDTAGDKPLGGATVTLNGGTMDINATAGCPVPAAGNVVAHYNFDDPADLGKDVSGNEYHATSNGTPIADGSTGHLNGAVELIANSGSWFQMPDFTAAFGDGSSGQTLVMWTKKHAADLVDNGTRQNSSPIIQLGAVTNDHYVWDNNVAYFNVFRNARVDNITTLGEGGNNAPLEAWHMITIVRDPGADTWKIFYNDNPTPPTNGSTTAGGFALGQRKLGASSSYNGYGGWLDEVVLYNTPLSTAQIAELYGWVGATQADYSDSNVIVNGPGVSTMNVTEGPVTMGDLTVNVGGSLAVTGGAIFDDVALDSGTSLTLGGGGGGGALAMASGSSLITSGVTAFNSVSMADGTSIDGGGADFLGGALTLDDGGTVTLAGGAAFTTTGIAGGSGRAATVNVPAVQSASLGGLIDGGVDMTLTKGGDGTASVSGSVLTGGSTVLVTAGTLRMHGDNTGIDAGNVVRATGGVVRLESGRDGIGNTDVELGGGTLYLGIRGVMDPGLHAEWYDWAPTGNWDTALVNWDSLDPYTPNVEDIAAQLAYPSANLVFATERGLNENSTARFLGKLYIPPALAGQPITFRTNSDDGSVMWVDGAELVNNRGGHGPQDRDSSAQTLTEGFHDFVVSWYDSGGEGCLYARWNTGAGFVDIPAANLFFGLIADPYDANVTTLNGTASFIESEDLDSLERMGTLTMEAGSSLTGTGKFEFGATTLATGVTLGLRGSVGTVSMADGSAIAGAGDLTGGAVTLDNGATVDLSGVSIASLGIAGGVGRAATVNVGGTVNTMALSDDGNQMTLTKGGAGTLDVGPGSSLLTGSTVDVTAGVMNFTSTGSTLTGAILSVSDGRLNISGDGTGIDGATQLIANPGGTVSVGVEEAPIGSAVVRLNGGTLEVPSAIRLGDVPGLAASRFDRSAIVTPADADIQFTTFSDAQDGTTFTGSSGVMTETPDARAIHAAGELSYNGNFQVLFPGQTQTDFFDVLYSGYYTPPTDGDYFFRFEWSDDRASFYMDTDLDGTLELVNWDWDQWQSRTLEAGTKYPVAIGFAEWEWGENVRVRMYGPGISDRVVNPSDPAQGDWTYRDMTYQPFGNNVNVTESSNLVVTGPTSGAMGDLDIAAGKMLTITGGMDFGAVTLAHGSGIDVNGPLTGTSLSITGTTGVGIRNAFVGNLGPVSDGNAPATLIKNGAGTLQMFDTSASTQLLAGTKIQINEGTVSTKAGGGFRGIGDAEVVLKGGDLEVEGAGVGYTNGLAASYIHNPAGDGALNLVGSTYQVLPGRTFSGDQGVLGYAINDGKVQTGDINYGFPGIFAIDWWDNFSVLWTGKMTAPTAGEYWFYGWADDRAMMHVDLNDNGVFDAGERLFGAPGINGGETLITFAEGETHNVALLFHEGGGGEWGNFQMRLPGGGNVFINPTNQAGMWQYLAPIGDANYLANNITVQANGAINVQQENADFGKLTIGDGLRLDLNGSITFTDANFTGSSVTLGLVRGASRLGPITKTAGAFTLNIAGGTGVLDIPVAHGVAFNNATTVVISGGQLTAHIEDGNTSLGHGGQQAAVTLAGGKLKLAGQPAPGAAVPIAERYYSFDNSGDATNDDSGTGGPDGVFQGTAAWTASGYDGTGGMSTPAGNDWMQTQAGGVAVGTDWTLSVWFYNLAGTGSWRTLARGSATDHHVIIESGTSRLGLYGGGAPGGFGPCVPQYDLTSDAAWHHIVAVGTGGTTTFYIDGNMVGDEPYQVTADIEAIGNIQSAFGGNQRFADYLDEVAIWTQALDANQVASVYANGVIYTPPPPTEANFGTKLTITASSELEVYGDVTIGDSSIADGSTLTVTGSPTLTIPRLEVATGGGHVGISPAAGVDVFIPEYADLIGGWTQDVTFGIGGGGRVIFNNAWNGMGATSDSNTTFDITSGTLVVVMDDIAGLIPGIPYANSLPKATFQLNGGRLAIVNDLADGNDLVLQNELTVTANGGTLYFGSAQGIGHGASGWLTPLLNLSAPIETTTGGTLTFETDAGFTIDAQDESGPGLAYAVTGGGGVATAGSGTTYLRVTSYTGPTIVNGGTLKVADNLEDTSSIDVLEGKLFMTYGEIDIDGDLYVAPNGTLWTGAVSVGHATLEGTVELWGGLTTTGSSIVVNSGTTHNYWTTDTTNLQVNGGTFIGDGLITSTGAVDANGGLLQAKAALSADGFKSIVADEIYARGGSSLVAADGGRLEVTGILDANSITIADGGTLVAKGVNTLSVVPSFTVGQNGRLALDVAQATLPPLITVDGGGMIGGNMTGVIYSGAAQNVALADGAVYGGKTGPDPNTNDLGADKLLRAIVGYTGESIAIGNDGNGLTIDDIYSGAAYGDAWTTGQFVGTISVGNLAAVDVALNGRNETLASSATIDVLDGNTDIQFSGAGSLTVPGSSPIGGSAKLFSRLGDGTQIDQTILTLGDASVTGGQIYRIGNGRVDVQSDNTFDSNTDGLTLMSGSFWDMNGRRPNKGKFTVEAGGMVWVNDKTDRFTQGDANATWAWQKGITNVGPGGQRSITPGAILAFNVDDFDANAVQWPTNVSFVFADHGNCQVWNTFRLPISDGAYMIGRTGGDNGFDGGKGPQAALGSVVGDTVGLAMPYNPGNPNQWDQQSWWFNDIFDLRFQDDANFALNLVFGADDPMVTVAHPGDMTRLTVPMSGRGYVRNTFLVGDLHVRSGTLQLNTEWSEATDDGLIQSFQSGDIYGYNGHRDEPEWHGGANLWLQRIDNFNKQERRSIDGSIYWRGDRLFVERQQYFVDALRLGPSDPNAFANEIVIGSNSRVEINSNRGDDVRPWDPTWSRLLKFEQPFRIEADSGDWDVAWNLRFNGIHGDGEWNNFFPSDPTYYARNHIYLPTMVLEDGATLSIKSNDGSAWATADLTFEGNASTVRRYSTMGYSDTSENFNVLTARSTVGDVTWTIGQADQRYYDTANNPQYMQHEVYGQVGDSNGVVTMNIVNAAVLMYTGRSATDTVGDIGWGDGNNGNSAVTIGGASHFVMQTDQHATGGVVNVNRYAPTITVLNTGAPRGDGGGYYDARLTARRMADQGGGTRTEFERVVLEPGATVWFDRWDHQNEDSIQVNNLQLIDGDASILTHEDDWGVNLAGIDGNGHTLTLHGRRNIVLVGDPQNVTLAPHFFEDRQLEIYTGTSNADSIGDDGWGDTSSIVLQSHVINNPWTGFDNLVDGDIRFRVQDSPTAGQTNVNRYEGTIIVKDGPSLQDGLVRADRDGADLGGWGSVELARVVIEPNATFYPVKAIDRLYIDRVELTDGDGEIYNWSGDNVEMGTIDGNGHSLAITGAREMFVTEALEDVNIDMTAGLAEGRWLRLHAQQSYQDSNGDNGWGETSSITLGTQGRVRIFVEDNPDGVTTNVNKYLGEVIVTDTGHNTGNNDDYDGMIRSDRQGNDYAQWERGEFDVVTLQAGSKVRVERGNWAIRINNLQLYDGDAVLDQRTDVQYDKFDGNGHTLTVYNGSMEIYGPGPFNNGTIDLTHSSVVDLRFVYGMDGAAYNAGDGILLFASGDRIRGMVNESDDGNAYWPVINTITPRIDLPEAGYALINSNEWWAYRGPGDGGTQRNGIVHFSNVHLREGSILDAVSEDEAYLMVDLVVDGNSTFRNNNSNERIILGNITSTSGGRLTIDGGARIQMIGETNSDLVWDNTGWAELADDTLDRDPGADWNSDIGDVLGGHFGTPKDIGYAFKLNGYTFTQKRGAVRLWVDPNGGQFNIEGGQFYIDKGASLDNVVVNNLGKLTPGNATATGDVRIYAGRYGDPDDPTGSGYIDSGTINLAGDQRLYVWAERGGNSLTEKPWVNVVGAEINVIDDGKASTRDAIIDVWHDIEPAPQWIGTVQMTNLHLHDGSRVYLESRDGWRVGLIPDITLDGNAQIDDINHGDRFHLGNFSGSGSLTYAGDDTIRAIGELNPDVELIHNAMYVDRYMELTDQNARMDETSHPDFDRVSLGKNDLGYGDGFKLNGGKLTLKNGRIRLWVDPGTGTIDLTEPALTQSNEFVIYHGADANGSNPAVWSGTTTINSSSGAYIIGRVIRGQDNTGHPFVNNIEANIHVYDDGTWMPDAIFGAHRHEWVDGYNGVDPPTANYDWGIDHFKNVTLHEGADITMYSWEADGLFDFVLDGNSTMTDYNQADALHFGNITGSGTLTVSVWDRMRAIGHLAPGVNLVWDAKDFNERRNRVLTLTDQTGYGDDGGWDRIGLKGLDIGYGDGFKLNGGQITLKSGRIWVCVNPGDGKIVQDMGYSWPTEEGSWGWDNRTELYYGWQANDGTPATWGNLVIDSFGGGNVSARVPRGWDENGYVFVNTVPGEINIYDQDGDYVSWDNPGSIDSYIASYRADDWHPANVARTNDDQGVVHFQNVVLHHGANLRFTHWDADMIIDLVLDGNSTITEFNSGDRFHFGNITGTGEVTYADDDTTWMIGELSPGVTFVDNGRGNVTRLGGYGLWEGHRLPVVGNDYNANVGLVDPNIGYQSFKLGGGTYVFDNPENNRWLDVMTDFSDANGGTLVHLGRQDSEDHGINIYYGQHGGTWGDPNAEIQLHDRRLIRVNVDAGQTNEINVGLRVMAGATGNIRTRQGDGVVQFNHVLMEEGATLQLWQWDNAWCVLSGEMLGDANIANRDNDWRAALTDWTGPGTMTITGNRHMEVRGTIATGGFQTALSEDRDVYFRSGSVLAAGVVNFHSPLDQIFFDSGSTIDAGTVTFEGQPVTYYDGMNVTMQVANFNVTPNPGFNNDMNLDIGTGNFNTDMDLRNVNLEIDLGVVSAGTTTIDDATGAQNWQLNTGGTLRAEGGTALDDAGTVLMTGGTLQVLANGPASTPVVLRVQGMGDTSTLDANRLDAGGGTGQTLTFGSLVLEEGTDNPELDITSANGYKVEFGSVVVEAASPAIARIRVISENTTLNTGPISFAQDNSSLLLDANTGSMVVLGPLDGNATAKIEFGLDTAIDGGGIRLSNSTTWDGKVYVDDATLTVDANLDGYDRGVNNPSIFVGDTSDSNPAKGYEAAVTEVTFGGVMDMSEYATLSLKISESMANVIGPMGLDSYKWGGLDSGLIGGALILNHDVDPAFRQARLGGAAPGNMMLINDVGGYYGRATAMYSVLADANYAAPLELVGEILMGNPAGGGQDFLISGVISDGDAGVEIVVGEMPGGIRKVGNETLTLSNVNTFTGAVVIEGGTLVMANVAALGDSSDGNNHVELLANARLVVAADDANFEASAGGYDLRPLPDTATLKISAAGANLKDAVLNSSTLIIDNQMVGASAPTTPPGANLTTIITDVGSVSSDYVVFVTGTIESNSVTVNSIEDFGNTTFNISGGSTLTITDNETLDDSRTWDVPETTSRVLYSGDLTVLDPCTLTKAGYGVLELTGNNNIAHMVIGSSPGGTVIASSAAAAPADVVIHAGSRYSVQVDNYTYAEVNGALNGDGEGIIALTNNTNAEIDLSNLGGADVFLGTVGTRTFDGNVTPGPGGYFFVGDVVYDANAMTITDVLADVGGPTDATFGWFNAGDTGGGQHDNDVLFTEGTVILDANNTLTGTVRVRMPVRYAQAALQSATQVIVDSGGMLDLNGTGAREDHILAQNGGSVSNTGSYLLASSIQNIFPSGDYYVGSNAGVGQTTAIEDSAFSRPEAWLFKIGNDTIYLWDPCTGAGDPSLNAYATDRDGNALTPDRGNTTIQGGTLNIPNLTALGNSINVNIENGAGLVLRNAGAIDAQVNLSGTITVADGGTLDLTDANAGFTLTGASQFIGNGSTGTLDIGDDTYNGAGTLTMQDGTWLKTRWSNDQVNDALRIRENSIVEYTATISDGVSRRIGELWTGGTIQFNSNVNNGTGEEHTIRLMMDQADPDYQAGINISQATPYRIGGDGSFRHRPGGVNSVIATPRMGDGNTPVAYIEKFGTGTLTIGGASYRPDDGGQARKYDWHILDGTLASDDADALTFPSALGATAYTWLNPGAWETGGTEHEGISRNHLERIEVESAAALQWRGTQGFLPESTWVARGFADTDGNGFNPGELVFQDGATLIGSPNYGLTLGFVQSGGTYDGQTFLCYPTVIAASTPTLNLGGRINFRSGIQVLGNATVNLAVTNGNIDLSGDLDGNLPVDVVENLTLTNSTVTIRKSHAAIAQTTLDGSSTLALDSGGSISYDGLVASDGLLHAKSGVSDLSTVTITTPHPGTTVAAGIMGYYHNYDPRPERGVGAVAVDAWPLLDDPAAIALWRAGHVADVQQVLNLPVQFADTLDNPFDPNAPGVDVGVDNIVAFWEGQIQAPDTGNYTFSTTSDDGTVMIIDGSMVVNNNAFQAETRREGSVVLSAGWHDILIGFYEGDGGAGINDTTWSNDQGLAEQTIPNSAYRMATIAGRILVDSGATLNVAGFTDTGRVTVDGTLNIAGTGTSNTEEIRVNPGAVLNLGTGALDANFGMITGGSLLGSGIGLQAQFNSLTIGGTSPTVNLGPTALLVANNANINTGFTFDSNNVSSFTTMGVNADVSIGTGAVVTVETDATVAMDKTLSIDGGQTQIAHVTNNGMLDIIDGTGMSNNMGVANNGVVNIKTGAVADLRNATIDSPTPGPAYVNGIHGSMFLGTPDTDVPTNLDGANYEWSDIRVFTGDKANTVLTMAEDAGRNGIVMGDTVGFAEFGGTGGDHFITAVSGRFFPDTPGSYNFHWNNDDAGLMYIDMDDDGVFDASDRVAAFGWNMNGSKTLEAGKSYNFIYMAQEYGGGEAFNLRYTAPGGGEVPINATVQAGQWKYQSGYLGVINVEAASTLRVGAFTNAAIVNATGTVELYNAAVTSTAELVNIPDGGTMNIRNASLDANYGSLSGSLLGDGTGKATFRTRLVVEDALSPTVNLSGGTMEALGEMLIKKDGFAFDGGQAAKIGTLNMEGPISVKIESTGNVQASQVNIAMEQSLVLKGGTTQIDNIENNGTVRAQIGLNDLSDTIIHTVQLPPAPPAAESLDAYWRLEGDLVDQANGVTGINHNGATFVNDVPPTFDPAGQSLSFNGADQAIEATIDVSETSSTVAMWFKTSTDGRGFYSVNNNYQGGENDRNLFLSGGNVQSRLWGGAAEETIPSGGTNYADGQWHHMAVVFGGDQGVHKLYVDGALKATGTMTVSAFDWQNTIEFGWGNNGGYWAGLIDEVTLYHEALSPEEVQALYEWTGVAGGAGFLTVDSGAQLKVKGFGTAGLVTVGAGSLLQLGQFDSNCIELQLDTNGLLDVGQSLEILEPNTMTLAQVISDIEKGRNGGGWDGPDWVGGNWDGTSGITSSIVASHPEWAVVASEDANGAIMIELTIVGDSDLDGDVDRDDRLVLEAHFNQAGEWTDGDLDYDGMVDFEDYLLWKKFAGQTFTGPGGGIPEPATLALLAFGGAALLARRRRGK